MATFKRSLAMILCVMMLLTATPLTALAEEAGTDSQEPVVETQDIVVNETDRSRECAEEILAIIKAEHRNNHRMMKYIREYFGE